MAGTANDYVGTLSHTRSNRTCAAWMSDYDYIQSKSLTGAILNSILLKNEKLKQTIMNKTMKMINPLLSDKNLEMIKPIHQVDKKYFNDSLYPEQSVRNASNYCRNPSRNIAGAWCYTTDPLVPWDFCNIRDCEKTGTWMYRDFQYFATYFLLLMFLLKNNLRGGMEF